MQRNSDIAAYALVEGQAPLQAKGQLPEELSGRVEFLVGDAERLPFTNGSVDLVRSDQHAGLLDEVARMLAPRGYVVVVSSLGPKTPFHTPERALHKGFRRRGAATVATEAEGPGTFFWAGARREEGPATGSRTPRERSDACQRPTPVGTLRPRQGSAGEA